MTTDQRSSFLNVTRWKFSIVSVLLVFSVWGAGHPLRADQWPIQESGQTIGVIHYDPATLGQVPDCWITAGATSPAGTLDRRALGGFLTAVSQCVVQARTALQSMGWPRVDQVTGFTVELGDLGSERLGVATSTDRMKLTVPDRIDDDEEHFIRLYSIVAHEYLHLCQFQLQADPGNPHESSYLWWMEATAIYFEYWIAPKVPGTVRKVLTYEDALDGARGQHALAGLESGRGGSSLGYDYAPLAFLLARSHGNGLIHATWKEIRRSVEEGHRIGAMAAIAAALQHQSSPATTVTFPAVFRHYVLHLLSPAAGWIHTGLGLDVVRLSPLTVAAASPQVSASVNLPGFAFQVFAPDVAGTDFPAVLAALSGDARLECYVVADEGQNHSVRRLTNTSALDLTAGCRYRLLVINPTAVPAAGALTLTGAAGRANAEHAHAE